MAVAPTAQNAGCTNAVNLKGQGQLARGAGGLAITAQPPADAATGLPLAAPGSTARASWRLHEPNRMANRAGPGRNPLGLSGRPTHSPSSCNSLPLKRFSKGHKDPQLFLRTHTPSLQRALSKNPAKYIQTAADMQLDYFQRTSRCFSQHLLKTPFQTTPVALNDE
jgi:hypothetical protein